MAVGGVGGGSSSSGGSGGTQSASSSKKSSETKNSGGASGVGGAGKSNKANKTEAPKANSNVGPAKDNSDVQAKSTVKSFIADQSNKAPLAEAAGTLADSVGGEPQAGVTA